MKQGRKICIVTSTRADYGLFYWLMKQAQSDKELQLQIIVTGMHLSPQFGLTYRDIEDDGFTIDEKIEILVSSDSPAGTTKSIGLATIGFADAFQRLKPDIMVLLGDRYEILAAAQAALVAKIPIAHIGGGDTTEGAFDEAIRHSITKMAHLHFVTNEAAAKRVRQLGENPEHIYHVGSPGLDFIQKAKLLSRAELEQSIDFKFQDKNLLVTYHPATLDLQSPAEQFTALLEALSRLGPDWGLIFTKPNSDTGSNGIAQLIDEYVFHHPNARAYVSLGQVRYLSTIAQVDAVVGNSSSGIYEIPSFKKPTVNIGDRQKGRIQAASVINCSPDSHDIYLAIKEALELDCSSVINPYGDGRSSERILAILKEISNPLSLLKKHFFEV
jgi:UDP-hydrolysing UDP-N-acetyl-D-glucosamine 2-epimerase